MIFAQYDEKDGFCLVPRNQEPLLISTERVNGPGFCRKDEAPRPLPEEPRRVEVVASCQGERRVPRGARSFRSFRFFELPTYPLSYRTFSADSEGSALFPAMPSAATTPCWMTGATFTQSRPLHGKLSPHVTCGSQLVEPDRRPPRSLPPPAQRR